MWKWITELNSYRIEMGIFWGLKPPKPLHDLPLEGSIGNSVAHSMKWVWKKKLKLEVVWKLWNGNCELLYNQKV